jgi:hypothetical protein
VRAGSGIMLTVFGHLAMILPQRRQVSVAWFFQVLDGTRKNMCRQLFRK